MTRLAGAATMGQGPRGPRAKADSARTVLPRASAETAPAQLSPPPAPSWELPAPLLLVSRLRSGDEAHRCLRLV